MVSSTTVTNTRGDATRAALISAGLEVFSRDGFDAASTRAIADTAGVQQALIGFHFGGKEGLYLAVFQSIAEQMNQRLKPIADGIDAQLTTSATKAHALELLLGFVDAIVAVLVRDESSPWARLIAREQQQPSRAFEILHEQFFGPMNALLTRLVMSVRGDTESEACLTVVSIMGQMLVLRLSRAVVLRQLGWSKFGDKELRQLQAHLRATITAQLVTRSRTARDSTRRASSRQGKRRVMHAGAASVAMGRAARQRARREK